MENEILTNIPVSAVRFRQITDNMNELYQLKNKAYGDSFHTSVKKYGLIAALTRMSDKFNRLENLIINHVDENDEPIADTLIDLASYCIMTLMEVRK